MDIIKQGNNEILAAARQLNIPVNYMAVAEDMSNYIKIEFNSNWSNLYIGICRRLYGRIIARIMVLLID